MLLQSGPLQSLPALRTQPTLFISRLHKNIGRKNLPHSAAMQREQAGNVDKQSAATALGSLPAPRVLSIQSSVVHGYVGNKCAIFPLQLLGFDVDPVFSVQFSNHTGYPVIKGHVFDGQHLLELLAGLKANDLLCHTHLLSGYIGSESLLEAVGATAVELKKANPKVTYVCDPVLGDEGNLYVKPELVAAYRQQLVPLADVLTPNQFEAELLTELPVKTESQAAAAAAALQDMGPRTVIITSMTPLPHPEYRSAEAAAAAAAGGVDSPGAAPDLSAVPGPDPQQQQQQPQHSDQQPLQKERYITLIASTRVPQQPGCPSVFCLRIPRLPGYFTGTGDLLAALLLAWIHKHPGNLALAVEKAVAGLQAVLAATMAAVSPAAAAVGQQPKADMSPAAAAALAAAFKAKELRVIQSQQQLVDPSIKILAEKLLL